MDFTTLGYYTWFLPAVVVAVMVLHAIARHHKWALSFLHRTCFWLASGWHVILLATSTCADWFIAKRIAASEDQKTKKRLLIATLTLNLGLLATFKYLDMLIDTYGLVQLRADFCRTYRGLNSSCPWASRSTPSRRCPIPLTCTVENIRPMPPLWISQLMLPSSHNWSLDPSSERPFPRANRGAAHHERAKFQAGLHLHPLRSCEESRVRRQRRFACGCGVHRGRGFGEHCLGVVGNALLWHPNLL